MSLKLTGISKRFDRIDVLRNIDIEIGKGEFLVLLGASGCGKSTLLNCIAGLEDVSGGTIEIGGRDVTGLDPGDRNVAMVFQSYALYPTMTVERNISFGLVCQGVPRADRRSAVTRVAELLRIGDLLDRKPSQLSGGQRQRVAIGRALVRDPEIFLLDEPMSNLDVKLRNRMRVELRDLHARLGTTFVLVTHDQIEAMTMATRVAVLEGGRVQQFGTPHEIYHRPQNRFVAEFVGLDRMNFFDGVISAEEDGIFVETGGRLLPFSHYGFRGAPPRTGRRVVMGLRPEDIFRSGNSLDDHVSAQAESRVIRCDMTGGDVLAWFEFAGRLTACRLRSSRAPKPGERLPFCLDLENASLFDADTGERL